MHIKVSLLVNIRHIIFTFHAVTPCSRQIHVVYFCFCKWHYCWQWL